MAESTLLTDYLGRGLASSRPASVAVASGALAIWYSTDTHAFSYWNGSGWVSLLVPVYDTAAAVPLISGMTVINGGTAATISQGAVSRIIQISTTAADANLHGLRFVEPSTPYRIVFLASLAASDGSPTHSAMQFGWTDGTKFETAAFASGYNVSGAIYSYATAASSFVGIAAAIGTAAALGSGPTWVALHNDGTNLIWEYSADGVYWIPFYSIGIASSYVPSKNAIFFGLSCTNAALPNSAMTVFVLDSSGLTRSFA